MGKHRRLKLPPIGTYNPSQHILLRDIAAEVGYAPNYFTSNIAPAFNVVRFRDPKTHFQFVTKGEAKRFTALVKAATKGREMMPRGFVKASRKYTRRSIPRSFDQTVVPPSPNVEAIETVTPTVTVVATPQMIAELVKAGVGVRIELTA